MLAVDIDDTLVNTALAVIRVIHRQFGHVLSPAALRNRYAQPGMVPEWQLPPIQSVIKSSLESVTFISQLQPKQNAHNILRRVDHFYPISCYITSRADSLHEITQQWLLKHNFPQKRLITRTPSETRPDWKLHFLESNFPQTRFLLDDVFVPQIVSFPRLRLLWLSRSKSPSFPLPDNVIKLTSLTDLMSVLTKAITTTSAGS